MMVTKKLEVKTEGAIKKTVEDFLSPLTYLASHLNISKVVNLRSLQKKIMLMLIQGMVTYVYICTDHFIFLVRLLEGSL